jgi:hypothetical protein
MDDYKKKLAVNLIEVQMRKLKSEAQHDDKSGTFFYVCGLVDMAMATDAISGAQTNELRDRINIAYFGKARL